MYSTRNSDTKYFLSPTFRSRKTSVFSSPKVNSSQIITTENQKEHIEKLLNQVRSGGALSPEAIILSQSEIDRMKNTSAAMTKEELVQQKKIKEEQIENLMAAAKARKQKMLHIEKEKKRLVPPTEFELEKQAEKDYIRERAQTLMDEDRDDVKEMNKMIKYAKMVTIRDKQLIEKEQLRRQAKDENRGKDLMLEIERLKKVKFYEELDQCNLAKQKECALETIKQIREREVLRARALEEKQREGQEIVRKIREVQQEDAMNNFLRKKQQKEQQDQIFEENMKAISKKQERIRLEKEEEEKIVKYNIEKARKEAEYAAEQKRIKDAKEMEVAKLRELQEKYSDRQAEIDAIRAKRAVEASDRLAREKEKREAETKARMNRELWEVRRLQALEKEKNLQEQARLNRDEFMRIVENQKAEIAFEKKVEEERAKKIMDYADQLKKQMAVHEEMKHQAKRELLEEGRKIKQKLQKEKCLLENIKAKKLEELMGVDIPVKYTSELLRKKILF